MVFKQISKVMKNKTETKSLGKKVTKKKLLHINKTPQSFDLQPESQSQPFPLMNPTIHL